jgi:hypothetical protein
MKVERFGSRGQCERLAQRQLAARSLAGGHRLPGRSTVLPLVVPVAMLGAGPGMAAMKSLASTIEGARRERGIHVVQER